jgi:2-methylcitrate dehydratase PrpD
MIENPSPHEVGEHMHALTRFVSESSGRILPPDVALKGKLHFLDTIAAMVSGRDLPPGQVAVKYAARQAGGGTASIVGTPYQVPCAVAAFANGMLAHSDETDDSHADSATHPGCAVVPTALAYAEVFERSGSELLNAVVTGYDVGARINRSVDHNALRARGFGPHSIGGHWGAGAAGGALVGFTAQQLRFMFSYIGQQTSGINCWMRDQEHILKAFVFAGMPSRNGALAVEMVANGFTGLEDVLIGRGGFFFAFSDNPNPDCLTEGLGVEFGIMTTAIKKWTVGSPIQAALDSLLALMTQHRIGVGDVDVVRVRIPDFSVRVVDNREIPDINLQHCLALMLVDGTLTFVSSHDHDRVHDPEVAAVRRRIELIPDADLTAARPERQAIVEIDTRDGRSLSHRTYAVRGTPGDPMTVEEVVAKADELMSPIIGKTRSRGLIDTALQLETVENVTDLKRYWA